MLVVKIEEWPSGDVTRSREVGRMALVNISGLADTSDYVVVMRDRWGRESSTRIRGHRRSDGFWPLIARAARSERGSPTRKPMPQHLRELAARVSEKMYRSGATERPTPDSPEGPDLQHLQHLVRLRNFVDEADWDDVPTGTGPHHSTQR